VFSEWKKSLTVVNDDDDVLKLISGRDFGFRSKNTIGARPNVFPVRFEYYNIVDAEHYREFR